MTEPVCQAKPDDCKISSKWPIKLSMPCLALVRYISFKISNNFSPLATTVIIKFSNIHLIGLFLGAVFLFFPYYRIRSEARVWLYFCDQTTITQCWLGLFNFPHSQSHQELLWCKKVHQEKYFCKKVHKSICHIMARF